MRFLRLTTASSTAMQQIFLCAKKRISICLVTLLLFVSTLTISPTPALAAGDVVIIKCESDCTAAFTAGVVAGSAVTLAATGSGAGLVAGAGAGMTAIVHTAMATAAVPFATAATTAAAAAAAPVVVPVAVVGAVAGYAYLLWHQASETPASK